MNDRDEASRKDVNVVKQICVSILLALLLTAVPAVASEFIVRPGAKSADVTGPPESGSRYTYEMVSVIEGVPGNRFLIDRRLVRNHVGTLYWEERFTIVTGPEQRDGLAKHLEQANYAEITVTEKGVRFLIEAQSDRDNRLTEAFETMLAKKTYRPHDCDRVPGECRFTVEESGKAPLHLLRTSHFRDGLWRDEERYDKGRDPDKRDTVRDERVFSVDANGVLFDMRTTRRTGPKVEVFQMTRLSPPLAGGGVARPVPAPDLPDGSVAEISTTCEEPVVVFHSGERNWQMQRGDRGSFEGPDRNWKIACGSAYIGTACPEGRSHVRVVYDAGHVVLGCYEGGVPENPFG
jgi:hypothetical protein